GKREGAGGFDGPGGSAGWRRGVVDAGSRGVTAGIGNDRAVAGTRRVSDRRRATSCRTTLAAILAWQAGERRGRRRRRDGRNGIGYRRRGRWAPRGRCRRRRRVGDARPRATATRMGNERASLFAASACRGTAG